jgi:hypothetical protein
LPADESISVRWQTAGTYTLVAQYGPNESVSIEITIEPLFEVEIVADNGFLECGSSEFMVHCLDEVQTVFSTDPTGDVTWSSTGPIALNNPGATATGTYLGTGDFTVTASVSNGGGCVSEVTYQGTIYDVPEASIIELAQGDANQYIACLGQDLTFMTDPVISSPFTQEWVLNGASLSYGQSFTPNLQLPGFYTLQLFVSHECGCRELRDEAIIEVTQDEGYSILCEEVACAGYTLTYDIDLTTGQGLTCPNYSITAEPADADVVITSTGASITWPQVAMTTIGYVTITPDAGCVGCTQPTVIEVPIVGDQIEIFRPFCPIRQQSLNVSQVPGATMNWSIVGGVNPCVFTFDNGAGIIAQIDNNASDDCYGQAFGIQLDLSYNNTCTSEGIEWIAFIPELIQVSNEVCLGEIVSFTTDPVISTGSISYDLAGNTGTWNFSDGNLELTLDDPTTTSIVFNNFTVDDASYPNCEFKTPVDFIDLSEPPVISGPVQLCASGQDATYTTDIIPQGSLTWTVENGVFADGTTVTIGQSVIVNWGAVGPYSLTVQETRGDCEGPSTTINPEVGQTPDLVIVGGLSPCVDGSAEIAYSLQYSDGSPFDTDEDVIWSIYPSIGTVVSGNTTTDILVQWLRSTQGLTTATLTATYSHCNESYTAELVVDLQTPMPVEVTAETGCAGSEIVFSVDGNPNLSLQSVAWTITDQGGNVYQFGSTSGTLFWNTNNTPEPVAGPARVNVRVTYEDCSFVDIGSKTFEILFSPRPQLSYLLDDVDCSTGSPQPTHATLFTSEAASSSDVNYIWEVFCEDIPPSEANSTIFAEGVGLSSVDVVINPNKDCCYRVTTERSYQRDGQTYICKRTSELVCILLDCSEPECGGFCPQIVMVENPGPAGDPNCGTVVATARTLDCEGDFVNPLFGAISFAEWTVNPAPDPALTFGPESSGNILDIDRFSNSPRTFSSFQSPGVYSLTYYMENSEEGLCGGAEQEIEIPLVVDFSYGLACGGNDGIYALALQDFTEIISGAPFDPADDLVWSVRDGRTNAQLLSATGATASVQLPGEATAYPVTICLDASTSTRFINPDTPYSCQSCETVIVPALPVGDIQADIATDEACLGSVITFTHTGVNDPFAQYEWNFGDGSSSSQASPRKVFAEAGPQTISLTRWNAFGCSSTSELTINVVDGAIAGEILDPDYNDCMTEADLMFEFEPGQEGVMPHSFLWTPITANAPTINVRQSGVYRVTARDARGCTVTAGPERVMLDEPFTNVSGLNSPICQSDEQSVRFRINPDFTYSWQLDGGVLTPLTGTFIVINFSGTDLNPGLHELRIIATGVGDCEEELLLPFTVRASPPPLELIVDNTDCGPPPSVDFSTNPTLPNIVWTVDRIARNVGPDFTFYSGDDRPFGYRIAANANVDGCTIESVSTIQVPREAVPDIIAGCFKDCTDLPALLEDVSNGRYLTWEWVFVPEGSTTPVSCGQPIQMQGQGMVTPWADYASCGNGEYFLAVTYDFLGQACEAVSDPFCLTCPEVSCDGPAWIPQNVSCLGSTEGVEYYINFDTRDNGQGDNVSVCTNGIQVVDINGAIAGSVVGAWVLDDDGDNYNLEGRILASPGYTYEELCLYIPYCEGTDVCCSLGSYCDEQVVCLSDTRDYSDCNDDVCSDAIVEAAAMNVDCVIPAGSSAEMQVTFSDLSFQLPSNACELQWAAMYGAVGRMSEITVGGSDNSLDVDDTPGGYTIPEVSFSFIGQDGQQVGCVRIVMSYLCDGEKTKCETSVCFDLPPDCYEDMSPSDSPLVVCEGQEGEYNIYNVFVPLSEEDLAYELAAIAATYGAEASLEEITMHNGALGVWLIIQSPLPVSGVWLVLGQEGAERDWSVFGSNAEEPGFEYPGYIEGDIVRWIPLPDCNTEDDQDSVYGRSAKSSSDTPYQVGKNADLVVQPNPTRDVLLIELVGDEANDWKSLQVFDTDGRLQPVSIILNGANRARLQVSQLSPGMYTISVSTNSGELINKRFVKQ